MVALSLDGDSLVSNTVSVTVPGDKPDKDDHREKNSPRQSPPVNNPATGKPAIIGTLEVGMMLYPDVSGISDADGLNTDFTILLSGFWLMEEQRPHFLPARSANRHAERYRIQATDLGKALKLKVTFTDNALNSEVLSSDTSALVQEGPSYLVSNIKSTIITTEI